MKRERSNMRLGILGIGLLIASGCGYDAATESSVDASSTAELQETTTYEESRVVVKEHSDEKPAYWIGVRSHSAPPALLAQLDLTCGVVIDEVFANAPSDGQLQPHDVIFSVNDRKVGCARTLSCGINDMSDQPLSVQLYRKGSKETVVIQPQPIRRVGDTIVQFLHVSDYEKMMEPFPLAGKSELNDLSKEIEVLVFRPGFRLSTGSNTDNSESTGCSGPLMLEMSVSFRENDAGQLVTVVREGERKSEYTRESLDKACPTVKSLFSRLFDTYQPPADETRDDTK